MERIGHYYTVYYAALKTGFSNDASSKIAFHTQLADQVDVLDAFKLFFKYLVTSNSAKDPIVKWSYLIYCGVHGMTGGFSANEISITEHLFKKMVLSGESPKIKLIGIGFLLHRLGDCYAHTKKEFKTISPDAVLTKFPLGHSPFPGSEQDFINFRPEIYKLYIQHLFKLLSFLRFKKFPKNVDEKSEEFSQILLQELRVNDLIFPVENKEIQYTGMMIFKQRIWFEKKLNSLTNNKISSYNPFDETLSFSEFIKRNSKRKLIQREDLTIYLKLAVNLFIDVYIESLKRGFLKVEFENLKSNRINLDQYLLSCANYKGNILVLCINQVTDQFFLNVRNSLMREYELVISNVIRIYEKIN